MVSPPCLVCDASLGFRPRFSLVVDEDVKKPTKQTTPFAELISVMKTPVFNPIMPMNAYVLGCKLSPPPPLSLRQAPRTVRDLVLRLIVNAVTRDLDIQQGYRARKRSCHHENRPACRTLRGRVESEKRKLIASLCRHHHL